MIKISSSTSELRILAVMAIMLAMFSSHLFVVTTVDYHVPSKERTIRRLQRIPTEDEFANEYLYRREPFVIDAYTSLEPLMNPDEWTMTSLRERFGDVEFRSGNAPYPMETIKLGDVNEDYNSLRVFQFGTLPATFSLNKSECLPVFGIKYIHTTALHDNAVTACRLLEGVRIPSFIRNKAPLIPLGGLIVGGLGAETAAHKHEPAINILFHGTKRWRLPTVEEFTQQAGDLVFIPHNTEHYVKNLHPSVAWTFQFHENHFDTSVGVAETEALLARNSPAL